MAALALVVAVSAVAPARAQIQFSPYDWLMHRGVPTRIGANSDPGFAAGTHMTPTWVWPSSGDMPAEIVVDNINPAQPPPANVYPPATGQQFTFSAAADWTWVSPQTDSSNNAVNPPGAGNGTFGAWPPSAPSGQPDRRTNNALVYEAYKAGDYVWTRAVTSQNLASLGTGVLSNLPDLGETYDPQTATNYYKTVNNELDETQNANLKWARWSFGTSYPDGTFQGNRLISDANPTAPTQPYFAPIAPNQRYAVYIRYPASGTIDPALNNTPNGSARPNVDHVMVRVSWGANVNDPTTSRIFMVDFGGSGGAWIRVRSGAGDDRYFPYGPDANNVLNPIRVTLYNLTPDNVGDTTLYPNPPIVTADAVRLVPEALRGDIHASAVSARFPLNPANNQGGGQNQLTYFGRDETTGPVWVRTPAQASAYPVNGYPTMGFDPTLPVQNDPTKPNFNPLIADPTSSVRSAVFYCFQEDLQNNRFGKLVWRYPAMATTTQRVTVDDAGTAGSANFQVNPQAQWAQVNVGVNNPQQAYGPDYLTAQVTDPAANPSQNATAAWTQNLPLGVPGSTWSVLVWIPAGNAGDQPAQFANYIINTDHGPVTVTLDQRNTAPNNNMIPANNIGEWRLLATGIRFPVQVVGGQTTVQGNVTLQTDSAQDVAQGGNNRIVYADAVQFVSESITANSELASPLLADVIWPSGTHRQVVYFATTDGHVWALDALGPLGPNRVGGAPQPQSNTTAAYWVYPSITNPTLVNVNTNPQGVLGGPQDDPNYQPDAFNNVANRAIDGDLAQTTINNQTAYTVIHGAPALGAFVSSPVFVRVPIAGSPTNFLQYVVIGNQNGRVYAFDAAGRVDPNNNNDPYAVTFANGDSSGAPGTTRREMTWPSTARDKWLRSTAPGSPLDSTFSLFTDDPAKGVFQASPAANVQAGDPNFTATQVVAGAGDGHVYDINLANPPLMPNERISNSAKGQAADGAPQWQYPGTKSQLDAIVQPGALSPDFSRYSFTAGGRVYTITPPAQGPNGLATLDWVFPFTSAPPGNPNPNDLPPLETLWTAPVYMTLNNFNNGNPAVFIANTNGSIYAFDATVVGNNQPVNLWADPTNGFVSSETQGTTRASATFLSHLQKQETVFNDPNTPGFGPVLFLPNDAGVISAFEILPNGAAGTDLANGGRIVWDYADTSIGAVPVLDYTGGMVLDTTQNNNPPVPFATSTAWRGADAIPAGDAPAGIGGSAQRFQWLYEGDEGNQDTGEVNGQFHAYGNEQIGFTTPGTPQPSNGNVTIQIVDYFNAASDIVPLQFKVWNNIAANAVTAGDNQTLQTTSPYHDETNGLAAQPTLPPAPGHNKGVYVFELGDDIHVAAWGTYTGNTLPPLVHFTKVGPNTSVPIQVQAHIDTNYDGPALGPGVIPWAAAADFPLGAPGTNDPQTAGQQYTIQAYATVGPANAGRFQTPILSAGQVLVAGVTDPNDAGLPVVTAIANPLALSSAGPTANANFNNQVAWIANLSANNANSAAYIGQVVGNGNYSYTFNTNTNTFVPNNLTDVVAPIGFVSHGTSSAYTGIDANGNVVPALFVADRSNLWKRNQTLHNVRVDRREMHWGWPVNTTDTFIQATGNAMNPLPWEVFPNTVPNVSPDYPDVDRSKFTFQVNGQDMATTPVALASPAVNRAATPPTKTLNPTMVTLTVSVPKYQPANVNTNYFNINGQLSRLMSPMITTGGQAGQTPGNAQPIGTLRPGAASGYVGTAVVYVDTGSNPGGGFQGYAPQFSAGQRTTALQQQQTYRQLNVGVAVPPDVNLRTEETTIDLGNVAQTMGYDPAHPFAPSYMGQYAPANNPPNGPVSPWDPLAPLTGTSFFRPFTVRNQGNVNLVDLRIAKVVADYNTPATNPAFWLRLNSDQVEPTYTFNNPPLFGTPFDPLAGNGGTGIKGVVSSLDHFNTSANPNWDWNLWPYTIPAGVPAYVPNGSAYLTAAANAPAVYRGFGIDNNNNTIMARPTLHKPRPNDVQPTTLSVPDTAHGDPFSLLSNLPKYDTAHQLPSRDTRPKISLGIPLGQPAGTYSAPVFPFEDHTPEQWRAWLLYSNPNGAQANTPDWASNTTYPGDDDGLLDTVITGASSTPPSFVAEARSKPTFILKATVGEARLTNGWSGGTYPELDQAIPLAGNVNGSAGANIQPNALRDPVTGAITLFWPSNRVYNQNTNSWSDPGTNDSPWYLIYSQLNPVIGQAPFWGPNGAAGMYYDWRFANGNTQWWNVLLPAVQYPAAIAQSSLFPSQASQLPANANANTPLVPGFIEPNTVKHATPAVAQLDNAQINTLPLTGPVLNTQLQTWLFWQGVVTKNTGGASSQSFSNDTRTFYTQLVNGVPPNPTQTPPFSFLNDPALPKFGPKPVIVQDGRNNPPVTFLFWYGGTQDRTRLYYNSTTNLADVTKWSADTPLPTPGALEFMSDPVPAHRQVYTTWFNPAGETLDCIDVVYTGVLNYRRQQETLLTRYALEYPRDANGVINGAPTGRLVVLPVGSTEANPNNEPVTPQTTWGSTNHLELLRRVGAGQVWSGRDLAWVSQANRWDNTQNPPRLRRDFVHFDPLLPDVNNGGPNAPYIKIYLQDQNGNWRNGVNANGEPNPINPMGNGIAPPVFDSATGRVHYASSLGGQIIVDPQAGTVEFQGVSPQQSDRVMASYTPQTLRLNVTRSDSGALFPPAGADPVSGRAWAADPAFVATAAVPSSGSSSGPVSFIDRTPNPRGDYMYPKNGANNPVAPVDRMFAMFRKTGVTTTASAAIYYKTMRLMVRLPRGVLRNYASGGGPESGALTGNIVVAGNRGPYEVDWIRGRVYFTEADEGNLVTISFNYARDAQGNAISCGPTTYRVAWGDEMSTTNTTGDNTTSETVLPTSSQVNEGQVSAFKDPFQDKTWIFWATTRNGTTDLYYMTLSPQFYPQPGF